MGRLRGLLREEALAGGGGGGGGNVAAAASPRLLHQRSRGMPRWGVIHRCNLQKHGRRNKLVFIGGSVIAVASFRLLYAHPLFRPGLCVHCRPGSRHMARVAPVIDRPHAFFFVSSHCCRHVHGSSFEAMLLKTPEALKKQNDLNLDHGYQRHGLLTDRARENLVLSTHCSAYDKAPMSSLLR